MNPSGALQDIYTRLESHFGPTHWWPGDTPFEIAVGAILTQNTAWSNVEHAIANLKQADVLSPEAILACDEETLHAYLRPSGFFRVKAVRLRAFCAYLTQRYGGSMAHMAEKPLAPLRLELLQVAGIGPETADDILLYACAKPVFVVDAYTRRILSRHGLCEPGIGYEALRGLFEQALRADLHVYKEYHGLIVYTGKHFCRRRPRCAGCPLEPILREGQPILTA